jgi:hypothetical protein
MFNKYWGIAFVVIPFSILIQSVVDVRTSQNFVFMFFSFLSIAIFGFQPKKIFSTYYKPLIFFLVAAFLFQANSYFDYTLIQWVCTSLGIIVSIQMMNNFNKDSFREIVPFIVFAGAVQSTWIILNYFQIDPYQSVLELFGYKKMKPHGGRWVYTDVIAIAGSLSHKMLSSSFIACIFPFLFTKTRLVLAPLFITAIYLSDSSMGAVTLAVGCLAYLICLLKRKGLAISLGIGVLLSIFVYGAKHGGYFEQHRRLVNWVKIAKIHDGFNILKGGGPGYLEGNLEPDKGMAETAFRPAHNIVLDIYAAYGIFGIIAAIILLIPLLRILNQSPNKNEKILLSVLAGMLFNAMGSFPFHISATALLFMITSTMLINNKETYKWQQHFKDKDQSYL